MVYGLAEVAAPRVVLEERGGWELLVRPPEHPTTVTAAAERKRERRTMSPPHSPPLVVSREPRRQAAPRAQPGPCARRTAVESLDASSRDQRVAAGPRRRREERGWSGSEGARPCSDPPGS